LQGDAAEIVLAGHGIDVDTSRKLAGALCNCSAPRTKAGVVRTKSTFTLSQGGQVDRVGRSTLSSFQRVQEFLTQHPLSDAADALGAQAKELDDVIARLSSDSVDQEAGSRFHRVHTASQRTLREELYTIHMLPISRVAREVFGLSGMDRAFRMPRSTKVNQTLLAAAGAMAEAAEKQKEVFTKHGVSPDFIERLKSAAAVLEQVGNAKTESGRRRITATAAVKEQLKRGRKAVRLLNAILQPRLARDPELLAAWRSAKHVRPTPPIAGADAGGDVTTASSQVA
jgi:hypothetical protein